MALLFGAENAEETRAAAKDGAAAGEAPAGLTRPPGARAGGEQRVFSIRDLVAQVRLGLERQYADIWVQGEICNCRPAASGHIYLTLRDGDAQLSAVLFRAQAKLLRFRPQDGLAVLARGRITVYDSRGQLQLIAETLEPRGAGALQLAFEQLKTRLLAEGLFDQARKRPLPAYPRCVGVVTSTRGAVLHDIIQVTRRRYARLDLLVYPAVVQGAAAAGSVAAGVRWFNREPRRVDLIVIARGGGSLEDLEGFNDEGLARAIAGSALPVVSAVGHETDFTIADFVADLRAPTPSAAAEIITAAQHRVEERVAELDRRLRRGVGYRLVLARQSFRALAAGPALARLRADLIGRRQQRVDELLRRMLTAAERRGQARTNALARLTVALEQRSPLLRLALARRRLMTAADRLPRVARSALEGRGTRLERASSRLRALSPLAVLSRGYALLYTASGELLRDAAESRAGDRLRARLAEGELTVEVVETRRRGAETE